MKSHVTKRTKFPGITQHARELGCSRPHLWQVLVGQRKSKRLMKAYQKLTRSAA